MRNKTLRFLLNKEQMKSFKEDIDLQLILNMNDDYIFGSQGTLIRNFLEEW